MKQVDNRSGSGDRCAAALATARRVGADARRHARPRSCSACTPTSRAPAATYGVSSSNGVKMRFDEVNEAGGIHGRKIKLIVEDQAATRCRKAVQACNKLINRDKVFAFVAPLGTPMNNACFKDQFDGGRAQPVPALGRALDVRALRQAEVLRRGLLRRPDPRRHQVLRQEEGQEGRSA